MRRFHAGCDTPVVYDEVSSGYSCACTECDEDLYLFETYLEEVTV